MARLRITLIDLKSLRPLRWLQVGVLVTLFCASVVRAELAGDLASVSRDAQAFGANTSSQSMQGGATVYTQSIPNGVAVRQYVDANGWVFAVAWEGPVLPDFERLLGASFQTYMAAVRQQRRGVAIQTPELVIESGGMMRSFIGRAYLPAKLPVNLSAQDIR